MHARGVYEFEGGIAGGGLWHWCNSAKMAARDEAWTRHLAENGYVVVGDVVSRAAVIVVFTSSREVSPVAVCGTGATQRRWRPETRLGLSTLRSSQPSMFTSTSAKLVPLCPYCGLTMLA